jgi:hypothetical protein
MMGRLPKAIYLLAMAVIPLTVWATLTGLLVDGFYGSVSRSMEAQAVGQDLVTLVFAVPVTFGALILSFRGSQRGDILLLGQFAYFVYTYLSYAMLLPFNPLWLVIVAIFSMSLAGLIIGFASINAKELAARYEADYPRRVVAGYMILAGALVGIMWLGSIILPATISGSLPQSVIDESGGNLAIQVLDLGIVVPLSLTSGILLWRNHPAGYLIASVILVKAATLLLAILAMIVFMERAGTPASPAQVILFLLLFVVGFAMLIVHLRGLNQDDE